MVVGRFLETELLGQAFISPETKHTYIMKLSAESKKRLTASQRRFAMEMAVISKMTLGELLQVERVRAAVGA
jgi:hypothetical protein